MSRRTEQTRWTRTFVNALVQTGIQNAVISPGYRNTSLVSAILERDEIRTFSVFDERAAAYVALGQARITQRPSLLICTSGTAGAHYLPAIIEAQQSGLPLLVVTTDRPLSLDQCGAPQTIQQINLYGQHVEGFFELGDARSDEESLRAVSRKAAQAYERTLFPKSGPVHVNFRSEKPLELDNDDIPRASIFSVKSIRGESQLSKQDFDEFFNACLNAKQGLVIAGALPLISNKLKKQILSFCQRRGFALHAEATSQLRFSDVDEMPSPIVDYMDLYLRDDSHRKSCRPDLIIQLGRAPVSKGVQTLLQESNETPLIVISPEQWNDANNQATMVVRSRLEDVFQQAEDYDQTSQIKRHTNKWLEHHATLSSEYSKRVQACLHSETLTEGQITRAVTSSAPSSSVLFAANGLPVRHLDTFIPAHSVDLDILSQRGTSGIDGQVAGVLGAATLANKPTTALIGDIGFLHDISSLANSKIVQVPVVFVIINNAGGRIFEQLPIAKSGLGEDQWRYWTTPQNFDLTKICRGYGVSVKACHSLSEIVNSLETAYDKPGVTVVDAHVDSESFVHESEILWGQ